MQMNEFYNCDCMEYMATVPDKYFELAIVDPPYGIGESKDKSSRWKNRIDKRNGKPIIINKLPYKESEWDCKIPEKKYFLELFRISKNQIIWGGNYFIEHLKNTSCLIVWDKVNGENDFSDCEIAWTSFKTATRQLEYMWCGFLQGESLTNGRKSQGNRKLCEARIHPTQKPVALYRWLLQNYAKPKDKIFDSHVGSGSSIIACIEEGFEYVGCELDIDYYKAASARIETHKAQGRLFAPCTV